MVPDNAAMTMMIFLLEPPPGGPKFGRNPGEPGLPVALGAASIGSHLGGWGCTSER